MTKDLDKTQRKDSMHDKLFAKTEPLEFVASNDPL